MLDLDDGIDSPSSLSSDEDKTEAETKTAAPASGPMSHPCGIIFIMLYLVISDVVFLIDFNEVSR